MVCRDRSDAAPAARGSKVFFVVVVVVVVGFAFSFGELRFRRSLIAALLCVRKYFSTTRRFLLSSLLSLNSRRVSRDGRWHAFVSSTRRAHYRRGLICDEGGRRSDERAGMLRYGERCRAERAPLRHFER
jgi:hypothetical protein